MVSKIFLYSSVGREAELDSDNCSSQILLLFYLVSNSTRYQVRSTQCKARQEDSGTVLYHHVSSKCVIGWSLQTSLTQAEKYFI